MKRLMMILALLAMMVVAVGNAIPTSQAQDGLSEEELALLERLYEAVQKIEGYDAYVLERSELQSMDFYVSVAGFIISQSESTLVEALQTVTESGANVHVVATLVVDSSEDSPQGSSSQAYTAQVEARLVDGELYVNAEYLDSEGDAPQLPTGWIDFDSLSFDALEVLSKLSLDNLLDAGLDSDSPLDDLETLLSVVTEVNLTSETLDDGTEVDVITVVIGSDGVMSLLESRGEFDPNDPMTAGIVDVMGDNFEVSVQFKLDADDNIRYALLGLTIDMADFDISTMGIEGMPPGTTMSMTISFQEVRQYSNINDASLEPVEAPE